MGRHSQNTSAAPWFSYVERQELKKKWGTQRVRITSDSVLNYDACGICLHRAIDAVACRKGHMFCKGCVYEHLLSQKMRHKQMLEAYEEHAHSKQEIVQHDDEKKAQEVAEKFVARESGMSVDSTTTSGGSGGGGSGKKTELPSYWLPSLTPSADKAAPPQVSRKANTVCPSSSHVLRLKQLFPVKFTMDKNNSSSSSSSGSNSAAGRYMCPMCRKTLTNTVSLAVLRRCGHVVCHVCVKLVKKEKCCGVCSADCEDTDCITLKTGGSGYAEKGGKVVASQITKAFTAN